MNSSTQEIEFEEGGALSRATEVMQLLSHPARLQILCELMKGRELPVSELHSRVGLSQSALSQHLAKLREQRVVETRRDQQRIFYRIERPDVSTVIECLYGLYCQSG